jgi:hypothetical protein
MQLISSVTFTNVSICKVANGAVESIIEISNNPINGIHSIKQSDLTEDDYNRLDPSTDHDASVLNAIEVSKNTFTALNDSIHQ